jgi:hypothetical protein
VRTTPALWLEARRWRAAGRTARLWWRDDDASAPSAALDRLLKTAQQTRVPLTLAVVPSGDMPGLAARLNHVPGVCVVQHGVDHQNRRTGDAAGEFPGDWTQAQLQSALLQGWGRLQRLPNILAVFTPPWNDVHPRLEAALRSLGYDGWSAHGWLGDQGGGAELARADVHLDLLRWRGGARFRGRARLLDSLAAEMRRRREAGLWDAPIGLLTHHLVHDEAAWRFLGAFQHWSLRQRELTWIGLPEVVREACEVDDQRRSAGVTRWKK